MKYFKNILPYFSGLVLILTFPFFGNEMISFLYGEKSLDVEGVSQTSVETVLTSIFWVLVFIFLIGTIFSIILFLKKKLIKVSVGKQFTFCFVLPLIGYLLLISQLLDRDNLSVGLYLSIFRNDTTHLSRLLNFGADPNYVIDRSNPKNLSPLLIAANRGNVKAVEILLVAGANKSFQSREGLTALDIARNRNHLVIS